MAASIAQDICNYVIVVCSYVSPCPIIDGDGLLFFFPVSIIKPVSLSVHKRRIVEREESLDIATKK